jgi:hypothetical protein
MAERRMFAKTIIDSDVFLDMSLSAQALYFHLSMRADDEGFINNHKKLMRMIGSAEDDLKVLIAKKFILTFESGVIVIKHWKIHNYIRSDRLKKTVYQEEKKLIETKNNETYTYLDAIPLIETDTDTPRQKAYKESSLPYSFDYKIRQAFYGEICPVCGCAMEKDKEFGLTNRIPTIQHNKPISKGGKHDLENISVICKDCNITIKDNKTNKLNNSEVITTWDNICQSSDSQMSDECQHRLGKVRLGKINNILTEIPKGQMSGQSSDKTPTETTGGQKRTMSDKSKSLELEKEIDNNKHFNKYKNVFDYYLTLDLIQHRSCSKAMTTAMKKAEKELDIDTEQMKRMLKRHKEKVVSSAKSKYPVKERPLNVFFGQKKVGSSNLICSDYLDEVWSRLESKSKLPTEKLKLKVDHLE